MQHIVNESNLYMLVACVFFCLCICLYNTFTLRNRHRMQRTMPGRIRDVQGLLSAQLTYYRENKTLNPRLTQALIDRMKKRDNLFALEQARDGLSAQRRATREEAAFVIRPVMEDIARRNRRSREMIRVYIASLIQLFAVHSPDIESFLMAGLRGNSLYLRMQSLRSIAVLGNERATVSALLTIGASHQYYNEKCITDALMDYTGDRRSLIAAIFYALPRLNAQVQRAVVVFLTNLENNAFRQNLLQLLSAPDTDKEVRIALIKYFTALRYDAALDELIRLADGEDWECAAIAGKALGAYPFQESVTQLKRRVMDQNWFVRYNCAMSLAKLCPISQLQDVLNGNDRYAREIMQYALSQQPGTAP